MSKIFLAVVILGAFILPKDVIMAKRMGGPESYHKLMMKNFGDREAMVKKLISPLRASAKSEKEHEKITAFEEHLDENAEEWLKQHIEDIGSPVEFFQRLVKAYKGKDAVLRAATRPIFQKLPNGDELSEQFFTELNKATDVTMVDEHELCGLCSTAMLVIKLAAIIMDWSSLHDILRLICWVVLPDIFPGWTRVDIVCPAVLEIQGQVFYPVWRGEYSPGIIDLPIDPIFSASIQPTPRAICESQNLCFPPPETPEAQRTQIKVKVPAFIRNKAETHNHVRKTRQAVAYKVAQITDVHIDSYYQEGATTDCGLPVCCHLVHGAGTSGPWGEYQCNTPQKTVTRMFEWLNTQGVDFVLYSGDNAPHSQWDETVEHQLDCTRKIWETFNATMPYMKIYPTIGNHEMYPTNQFSMGHSEITQEMVHQLTDWWTPNAGFEPAQVESMRDGGYYTMPIAGKTNLRLISYNTNLMYTLNWFNVVNDQEISRPVQPSLPGERTAHHTFMEDALSAARVANEKVILMGHHPPGRMDYLTRESEWLTDLILQYSDIIVLHITGHTHRDEFTLVKDPVDGEAKSVIFTSPTMTPRGGRNPTIRIYDFDANHNLLNYQNHQLDVAKAVANPSTPPDINSTYSAIEEYELADMSPVSWQQLSQRFENDALMFSKYMYNHFTRAAPATICGNDCRARHLCEQRHTTFQMVYSCYQALEEPTTPAPPTPTAGTCPPPPPIHRCSCPIQGSSGASAVQLSVLAVFCACLLTLFK